MPVSGEQLELPTMYGVPKKIKLKGVALVNRLLRIMKPVMSVLSTYIRLLF
jgi:hypothetical protein